MLTHEQQCLLTAHAPADRVHALEIKPQPRPCGAEDARHACEIVDLTPPAPGVKWQAPAHPARTDHSEAALPRKIAPEIGIRPRPDAAAVRGDDERQRRRRMVGAVLRGRDDDGPAQHLVMSAVAQPPLRDGVAHESALSTSADLAWDLASRPAVHIQRRLRHHRRASVPMADICIARPAFARLDGDSASSVCGEARTMLPRGQPRPKYLCRRARPTRRLPLSRMRSSANLDRPVRP